MVIIEGNLKLDFDNLKIFGATDSSNGQHVPLSPRYGWSKNSCRCQNTSKTGLVFYPKDIAEKNIVLLVCETCFKNPSSKGTTLHSQLAGWYFQNHGDQKSIRFITGFSCKDNGDLGFNSYTFNTNPSSPFYTSDRSMDQLEQDIVRQVVQSKLDSYEVKP